MPPLGGRLSRVLRLRAGADGAGSVHARAGALSRALRLRAANLRATTASVLRALGHDALQGRDARLLRRLVVLEADASPTRHVECHALPGAKKKCERPNETTVHYVSKPEGAVKYYRTPEGARDGSSAPGYYWPRCSNSTRLGVGPNWSKCARSRSQVAQWKVLKSDCHKKESMTADPYMDTFVRDFA